MNRVFIFLLLPWVFGILGVSLLLAQFFFGIDLVIYGLACLITAMAIIGFNIVVGISPYEEL